MANQKSNSSKKNTTAKNSTKKGTTGSKGTKKGTTAKKTQAKNVTVEANVTDTATREFQKEIVLWITFAVCLLLFISNLGIGGFIGNAISSFFFGVFGIVAYILPFVVLLGVFFIISNAGNRIAVVKAVSVAALVPIFEVFVELMIHGASPVGAVQAYGIGFEKKTGGGFFGGLLAQGFVDGFGLVGAYVITGVVLIICVILLTEKTLLRSSRRRRRAKRRAVNPNEQREERLARIQEDKNRQLNAAAGEGPRRSRKISGVAFDTTVSPSETVTETSSDELNELHVAPDNDLEVRDVNRVLLSSDKKSKRKINLAGKSERAAETEDALPKNDTYAPSEVREASPGDTAFSDNASEGKKKSRKSQAAAQEMLENASEVAKEISKTKSADKKAGQYRFPPLSLLKKATAKNNNHSKAELEETADKLEQTLRNFGINVEVTDVTCGPTVTRYELLPEAGVRVNRITNLADDLKLNLAVTDIRIEAPIPGKAAVGIEVPNKEKVMVTFEELAASSEFKSSASKVTFCAGKDIAGNVITANIAKMPHLLIAGTTGSGKSVCINTIIMSILYKATPDEVKFIMIDPKVVELSIYNGIPHLLIPVVTEPKKAAGALHWAVMEMDDRYQKFANAGVRDIKSYNQKLIANDYKMPINSNGELGEFEKMPEMVVIVDELADLMMVAAKEVEESICRLAQKARAAGIYLILATQRPSVDVVTGLIKANMPSRIAFAVNSGVDSRTILDMFGAEKLLGNGDMLYYPQGYTKPLRVQGAFVSDTEVQNVVDFIKSNNENVIYDDNVSKMLENGVEQSTASNSIGGGSGFDDAVDSYFEDAARLVIEKEKGSIGMLQRYFRIGFNRAARIMDQLEEAGIVGPDIGTKPRNVLMTEAEFEQYLNPEAQGFTTEEEYPVSEDF